jgi:hypothetical protein
MAVQLNAYNYTATANIIAYDASTGIATLDAPVNISLGYNDDLPNQPGTGYGSVISTYSIRGTSTSVASAINSGNTLPALSSDESGNFVGIFNIPSAQFQTGNRVFRVDNRTNSSDQTTATTYAEATFTASGLSTTSQRLDFAPSVDSSASTFTKVSQQPGQLISTITTYSPYDPVAQTFIIDQKNYPNGAFLSSVTLFFQSVPSTNVPITVSIIPTLNGYPSGTALNYSTVTLQPNQVNVSQTPQYLDSTAGTKFNFIAPVYVQPGVLYAILIKSNSSDYNLWYAQQNKIAIPSSASSVPLTANGYQNLTNTTKIGSAPYVGALFESQNSITWTADQTKDLMFVLDQCVFNTTPASVPFVVPQRLPYRKLNTKDILHKVDPYSVSNIDGTYASNTRLDAINVSTTEFTPTSTQISYSYTATLTSGASTSSSSISPGKLGSPMPSSVALNDGQGERALLTTSTVPFSLVANMTTTDPNVSPIISDDGVSLYAVRYVINNMPISNNVINIANPGYGYNIATASVNVSSPDLVNGTTATFTISANANGAITSINTISGGSGYLTNPTITIYDPTTRGGSNANCVIRVQGETGSSGGNALARYFTKKVVMAPGNDSGDLRVFLSAYNPLGTGIYVYYKILNSQDTSSFESGNWQLMTCINNFNNYSTSTTNLIQYEFAPGVFNSNQANNNISYTNSSGQTYTSFIQFAIKIVMATNDPTNVPNITSLQVLALPSGTGL